MAFRIFGHREKAEPSEREKAAEVLTDTVIRKADELVENLRQKRERKMLREALGGNGDQ